MHGLASDIQCGKMPLRGVRVHAYLSAMTARAAICTLLLGAATLGVAAWTPHARRLETRNVVLVVTDGLRWQEVFRGADSTLLFGDSAGVHGDTAAMRRDVSRPYSAG